MIIKDLITRLNKLDSDLHVVVSLRGGKVCDQPQIILIQLEENDETCLSIEPCAKCAVQRGHV